MATYKPLPHPILQFSISRQSRLWNPLFPILASNHVPHLHALSALCTKSSTAAITMYPQKCPKWVFTALRTLVSLLKIVAIVVVMGGVIVSVRTWWTARSGTASRVKEIGPRQRDIKCTVNGVEWPGREATICFAR